MVNRIQQGRANLVQWHKKDAHKRQNRAIRDSVLSIKEGDMRLVLLRFVLGENTWHSVTYANMAIKQ